MIRNFLDRGTAALLTVLPDRHDVIECISTASQFYILEAIKVVLNKPIDHFHLRLLLTLLPCSLHSIDIQYVDIWYIYIYCTMFCNRDSWIFLIVIDQKRFILVLQREIQCIFNVYFTSFCNLDFWVPKWNVFIYSIYIQ